MSKIFTRIIIVIVFHSLLLSCTFERTDNYIIQKTLYKAAENRYELERVLNYYKDDSLKLKGAKFLISNMPGHYSYADTVLVNNFYFSIDSILRMKKGVPYIEIKNAIDSLYILHGANRFRIVEDVKSISADYLIKNIESAFNQWQNIPWARHLDFDQFCEYLSTL